MTDYIRYYDDVSADEKQNWPCGCIKSSHEFMDLSISPIVGRAYYNNEEIYSMYNTRTAELISGGSTVAEAQSQSKIELLEMIYLIDIINFKTDNPTMTSKCCRLLFHTSLENIATYHIVHGEALKFFGCTRNGDVELGISDDPLWGFDMTKPEEGFPCINLDLEGADCTIYSENPNLCGLYPFNENNLISTCSYQFIDGVRSGSCNQCIG